MIFLKLNKLQTRTIKEFTYTYDNIEELNMYKNIMLKAQFNIKKEDLDENILSVTYSQIINKK